MFDAAGGSPPVMCGRFSATDPARIAARFSRYLFPEGFVASYNVAPTQQVAALCNDRVPNVALLHWGLLPPWSKDKSLAYKTINARSETAAEKPMFRNAFRKRRCIVFADGYYEWTKDGSRRRPHRFVIDGGEPFAFAGVWEMREEESTEIRSCSILTTVANDIQRPIHDRMPVILDDSALDVWLSEDELPTELLRSLCVPFDARRTSVYEVDPIVNNARNDTAECITPITTEALTLL